MCRCMPFAIGLDRLVHYPGCYNFDTGRELGCACSLVSYSRVACNTSFAFLRKMPTSPHSLVWLLPLGVPNHGNGSMRHFLVGFLKLPGSSNASDFQRMDLKLKDAFSFKYCLFTWHLRILEYPRTRFGCVRYLPLLTILLQQKRVSYG